MLDLLRSGRVFDNFLDTQTLRIDTDSEGLTSDGRNGLISKIRKYRRARNAATDQAFEHYSEAKDEGFRGTFLDWLIQNQDLVMSILKTIMSLFGL